MNTCDVLNKAADIIEERGWGHDAGSMYGNETGVCIMGAIVGAYRGGALATSGESDATTYDFVAECPAGIAIHRYLELNDDVVDLWRWNDGGHRRGLTQADVVETLRACAVIEASRERESAEVSA